MTKDFRPRVGLKGVVGGFNLKKGLVLSFLLQGGSGEGSSAPPTIGLLTARS